MNRLRVPFTVMQRCNIYSVILTGISAAPFPEDPKQRPFLQVSQMQPVISKAGTWVGNQNMYRFDVFLKDIPEIFLAVLQVKLCCHNTQCSS